MVNTDVLEGCCQKPPCLPTVFCGEAPNIPMCYEVFWLGKASRCQGTISRVPRGHAIRVHPIQPETKQGAMREQARTRPLPVQLVDTECGNLM